MNVDISSKIHQRTLTTSNIIDIHLIPRTYTTHPKADPTVSICQNLGETQRMIYSPTMKRKVGPTVHRLYGDTAGSSGSNGPYLTPRPEPSNLDRSSVSVSNDLSRRSILLLVAGECE